MALPMSWWDEQRLKTDFTKDYALPVEVSSDVYDKPHSQRVFGSPVYDQEGNMRCRCCGGFMARSMGRNGNGLAICSDTGCQASGFEFVEGSYTANPHRSQ